MSTAARRFRLWFTLGFRGAPALTLCGLLIAVAGAILGPISATGAGRVVDGLIAGDGSAVRAGVWLLGAGIIAAALQSVSFPLIWFFVDDLGERYGKLRILQLISDIPTISHHEDPALADRVALAREDARELGGGGQRAAFHISGLVQTATVAVILGSIAWWLVLIIPAALVPAWASARANRARMDAENNNAWAVRTADRMLGLARDPGCGLEIRCSGAPAAVLRVQQEALGRRLDLVAAANRRGRWLRVLTRLAWIAVVAGALVGVFALVRSGSVPIGSLLVLVLLLPQIDDIVGALQWLSRYVVEMAARLERLDTLTRYAETTRTRGGHTAPARLADGIRLEQVDFSYRGSESTALQDVSLHLRAGSVVALVGENGAGKSTLVKLLIGLYEPTAGRILVDGHPLDEIDVAGWRSGLAGSFQDHADLQFLARESVGVGDLPRIDDHHAVTGAAARAGADSVVDELPDGWDTQLGRQFAGGTELSGGQWQRLAIARGILRTSPVLVVLDEPTSALDPQAEDRILTGYLRHAAEVRRATGAVTVIVSHRMSTVRAADRVIHLAGGRVIEDGTHDELMAAGGGYAELFDLQARAYR
jgi:ATP-binding cassette, subfamily B, bacterial